MGKLKTIVYNLIFQFILLLTLTHQVQAQESIAKPTIVVSIRDSLTRSLLPSVIIILENRQEATKTFFAGKGELIIL